MKRFVAALTAALMATTPAWAACPAGGGSPPVTLGTVAYYAAATGYNDAGNTCVSITYPCSITQALNDALHVDLGSNVPTVNMAAGTYADITAAGTGSTGVANPGQASVILQGAGSGSTTVAGTANAGAIIANDGARLQIAGMTVTSTAGADLFPSGGGLISNGSDVILGQSVAGQVHAERDGEFFMYCDITLSGAAGGVTAPSAFQAVLGGKIIFGQNAGRTVTLSGTPKYTGGANSAFADIEDASVFFVVSADWTFSGAANAATAKYYAAMNGVIETETGVLPGTVAGSTATGGQYH